MLGSQGLLPSNYLRAEVSSVSAILGWTNPEFLAKPA